MTNYVYFTGITRGHRQVRNGGRVHSGGLPLAKQSTDNMSGHLEVVCIKKRGASSWQIGSFVQKNLADFTIRRINFLQIIIKKTSSHFLFYTVTEYYSNLKSDTVYIGIQVPKLTLNISVVVELECPELPWRRRHYTPLEHAYQCVNLHDVTSSSWPPLRDLKIRTQSSITNSGHLTLSRAMNHACCESRGTKEYIVCKKCNSFTNKVVWTIT